MKLTLALESPTLVSASKTGDAVALTWTNTEDPLLFGEVEVFAKDLTDPDPKGNWTLLSTVPSTDLSASVVGNGDLNFVTGHTYEIRIQNYNPRQIVHGIDCQDSDPSIPLTVVF